MVVTGVAASLRPHEFSPPARRAVVTGGAGFLGSQLSERLLQSGYEVLCLDNFCTGSPENVSHLLMDPRFRLIRCNVTDFLHVPGPVTAVLHFASPASPIDYLRLPIQTLKVGSIAACAWAGKRQGRPLPAGVDLGVLRGPTGTSPTGDVLGPRESGRSPGSIRRSQAVR